MTCWTFSNINFICESIFRSFVPVFRSMPINQLKWNEIKSEWALVSPEMSHLWHNKILSVDVQGFRCSLDKPKKKSHPVQHSVGINALVCIFHSFFIHIIIILLSDDVLASNRRMIWSVKCCPRLKLTSRSRQKHLNSFTLNWKSNDLKLLFYIRREFHASRLTSESPGGENIKSLQVLWYRRRFFGYNFLDDVLMSRSFGRFSRLTTELPIKSLRLQKAKPNTSDENAFARAMIAQTRNTSFLFLSLPRCISFSLFFFRNKLIISFVNSTMPFQETVHWCRQLLHVSPKVKMCEMKL